MYRISSAAAQQMTIRYIPWIQWVIGLLFVTGGCSVLLFVFPNHVHLSCDRQKSQCFFEQSNLLRTESSTWVVEDLTGSRLEVVDTWNSGTAFTIWILTRRGPVPFTPYSIGGSREEKQAIVARINAFTRNPGVNALNEVEDERTLFYLLAAGLICFGLLPLLFVKTVTCRLDLKTNSFLLKNGGLWGRTTVERRLSDLAEASIDGRPEGGVRMCRVAFKFRSGEAVPLTYYRYHDCKKADKVAQAINEFHLSSFC